MGKAFETINHTADIGIRASGATLEEAYVNAARGLFSLITDLRSVTPKDQTEIEVSASDPENLLVAWLNELLYYFETEQKLFRSFEIRELTRNSLKALAWGEKVDKSRHHLKRGIKSTTYHMLKVGTAKAGGFEITVILDI